MVFLGVTTQNHFIENKDKLNAPKTLLFRLISR